MGLGHHAERLSLTLAQRHVINDDEVSWHGWDAKNLPVITTPDWGLRAVGRDGLPVDPTYPIGGRDT